MIVISQTFGSTLSTMKNTIMIFIAGVDIHILGVLAMFQL